MREILPGIYHWKTLTEGRQVDSYYIGATSPAVLIDPRLPKEGRDSPHGLEWFSARQEPKDIFLTSARRYRDAAVFAAAFGARIWCEGIKPFPPDAPLPAGIVAVPVGPGETAFYLPLHGGVLAADAAGREDAIRKALAVRPAKHLFGGG